MSEIRAASSMQHRQFEELYNRHFDRVASYVLARTDRDTAADVLNRAFEVAWRRREAIPSDPLPWLIGVARRVLADGRRASRRKDALVERLSESSVTWTEDHVDTLMTRDGLVSALARLTASQREALFLVAWDELTEQQAARVVGCSRGAFALRLHRARKQLRKYTATNSGPSGQQLDSRAVVGYRSAKEAL
jgi:RNA polymerase sigma-70 factor, ECF subfamily